MNKILCIGEALIDMICTDRGQALSDGQHFLKKAGGAPANVAAAIAAFGGSVDLAAKVGDDPFGKHLSDVLQSFGVSTKWVLKDPRYFTTFAFVSLMDNGERDFYFNRGADGQLSVDEIEAIDPGGYSIFHFGSATGFLEGPLQSAYKALLLRALDNKVFISFDPNYRHLLFRDNTKSFVDQSWDFLKVCDFFKVSDEESMLLTGATNVKDAAAALLAKTKAIFAITVGKEGALLGMNNRIEEVSGITVKPIDTTGAGDAFTGAVLYQLSQYDNDKIRSLSNTQWKEILFNGNKAGARTCEFMGAMEAFKHLSNNIFK